MSRHHSSRRRSYTRRQHELRERPTRWRAVVRQWEIEQATDGAVGRYADDWQAADFAQGPAESR
jgi:hypothetical protein